MKIFTWKQRIVVIFITLFMVALFATAGYAIGQAFENWRLGIALGALASYPFTQFTLVRAMKNLYEKQEDPETEVTEQE